MSIEQHATPPLKDCRTCNRRRIKCDRSLPACRKCSSRSLDCPGYRLHIRWKEASNVRVTSKSSVAIVPTLYSTLNTSNRSSEDTFPSTEEKPPRHGGEVPGDRYHSMGSEFISSITPRITDSLHSTSSRQLLHHFNQILAPQLAWVDSTDNPWQSIILPLALQSPSLMHSLLAMAAGDISDRHYGCAHMAADTLYGFTRNRNRALELLSEHLKQELSSTKTNSGQPQLNNHILASIVVLCYHEIKWPSSGLWKVHLRAARTMIRRWSHTDFTIPTSDATKSFLIQELSATQAMASVTCFTDEEPVRVSVPNDHRAPFLGFLQVIQAVSLAERNVTFGANTPSCLMNMEPFLADLEKAKDHAFVVGRGLTFRSSQSECDFEHMVNMYYEAGCIYTLQALSPFEDATSAIRESYCRLMSHLISFADTSLFAQDLPWPLFVAGTECDRVQDQQYIERRMKEMVRLTGTLDRMKGLRFLKEFWTTQLQGPRFTWIQLAKTWALKGDSFLIW